MRILYGITKSDPFGGAQRYVFDLAKEAARRGHEVAVLCGGEGTLAEKLRAEGIEVITSPHIQRDISIFKELKSFIFITKTLRAKRPDVFHINSSKMGGLGALAGRLMGIRNIIFTAHGWPFWEKRNLLSRVIIYFFSWLTAILAHKVITVSEYDLRVAKKMPFTRKKAIRIYNGISFETSFGDGEIIRNAFPAGAKIVGAVGELNANKNQIALVEEARKDPNMFVAIVGEGDRRDFLENKIREYGLEERVKLFGYMPREKVMKGFDVFALPSLKEGLPYVLIEAKLAGLPIEANRVGGVSEILDQDIKEFSFERMAEKTFSLY